MFCPETGDKAICFEEGSLRKWTAASGKGAALSNIAVSARGRGGRPEQCFPTQPRHRVTWSFYEHTIAKPHPGMMTHLV